MNICAEYDGHWENKVPYVYGKIFYGNIKENKNIIKDMRRNNDRVLLESLVRKYGKNGVKNAIKRINENNKNSNDNTLLTYNNQLDFKEYFIKRSREEGYYFDEDIFYLRNFRLKACEKGTAGVKWKKHVWRKNNAENMDRAFFGAGVFVELSACKCGGFGSGQL